MILERAERHRLVVLRLYVFLRAAEDHPARSPLVEQAQQACLHALAEALADEGRVAIAERASGLVVNGRRLRLDVGDWAAVEALLERMHKRGLASIVLESGVTGDDLHGLVGALAEDLGTARLARASLVHVQLVDASPEEPVRAPSSDLGRSQLRAVFVARRLLVCVDFQAEIGPAEQQRIFSIVAADLLADEAALRAFTILEGDPERLRSAVRRAVRVVVLARRLGVDEGPLRQLVLAALLEPVGPEALLGVGCTSDAMLRTLELAIRGRECEGFAAELLRAADRGVDHEAVLATLRG